MDRAVGMTEGMIADFMDSRYLYLSFSPTPSRIIGRHLSMRLSPNYHDRLFTAVPFPYFQKKNFRT